MRASGVTGTAGSDRALEPVRVAVFSNAPSSRERIVQSIVRDPELIVPYAGSVPGSNRSDGKQEVPAFDLAVLRAGIDEEAAFVHAAAAAIEGLRYGSRSASKNGVPFQPVPILLIAAASSAVGELIRTGVNKRWGWAPPDCEPFELRIALRALAAGFVVIHHSFGAFADSANDTAVREISPRERNVLEFLAAGFSNAEIGSFLGITEHTVKYHLHSVYRKLGASGRAEAVRTAIREGVIPA